jgi:hypothetical protein
MVGTGKTALQEAPDRRRSDCLELAVINVVGGD